MVPRQQQEPPEGRAHGIVRAFVFLGMVDAIDGRNLDPRGQVENEAAPAAVTEQRDDVVMQKPGEVVARRAPADIGIPDRQDQ